MQSKMANMRASAMGALGALGVAPAMVPAGAMGAARPPVSPTDTSGGAIPIVMPVMPQQAPQAASVPPIGSQVVCPMCQATVVIGRAGICTNCGNKIV
jgi:hypothetical protein